MDLKDKKVLITGASKGIGKATALMFAKKGADIIVNYRSDKSGAEDIVNTAKKIGAEAISIKADITNETEVIFMFEQIKQEFGSLDVLINNAGIFDGQDSPNNVEVFERIFKMNFLAQVRVTNHALPLIKTGKIVFVSSVHGRLGHGRPDAIAYSSMKAGLDSYMKNLAKHLAPDILVNSVAPGKTLTPQWGDMDDKFIKKEAKDHLTDRWIKPEEIADSVLFLVQNDSMCGEVLTVDAGMSIKVLG